MLWLCLHFPQLPLEIFSRAQADQAPWAVIQGKGARQTIFLCNSAAAALGIRPGMAPGAAHALSADLQIRPRDELAEGQALEALAAWAGQFTSLVSLAPPRALLLEIAGSLRYFGGIDDLLARVRLRAAHLGYLTELGAAPTPLSAWLLARARVTAPVMDREALPGALRDLPLACLDLNDKLAHTLHGIGLHRVGDVLRLPRAGLARRFGPALLDYLDRLLGRLPDPREPYDPPPRFERRLALPAETADVEALLFPARRLLLELAGFLAARQAGTRRLHWTLVHPGRPPKDITLGLAVPNRDSHHLLNLLRERLTRTPLDRPAEEIALRVADMHPLQPRTLTLDGEQSAPAEDWPQLVERLRARLGDEAVQGLQCRADHRPERAWHPASPGEAGPALPHAYRPLWLLPRPVPLSLHDGAPWLDSRLYIEAGPERLESGWWDGGDIARDYFVARDAAHSRYWIFRERRGGKEWFLHGIFA